MDDHRLRAPLSLALALVCLGGVTTALASAAANAPQVTVKYADLDLNRADGAMQLLARIRSAAQRVCGEQSARLDLQHAWQVCYEGSIATAVAAVDSPLLSALAAGHEHPVQIVLNR